MFEPRKTDADSLVPHHIAIIMDGNGRWATARGLKRSRGHLAGAQQAHRIIEHTVSLKVQTLSLFAFSTENWKRPRAEVDVLFLILRAYLKRFEPLFKKHGVRFDFIGDTSCLSSSTQQALTDLRDRTRENGGMTLVLAVNYSGQQDILQAANSLIQTSTTASAKAFEQALQTHRYGPVDLMIRTGGEQRLSNFYLWQAAYAEIEFSPKPWPEFNEQDFDEILARFTKTERRYGAIPKSPIHDRRARS